MSEETDLLVNTGCKTCDHILTEAAEDAVGCVNTLLRDREDARYYLTAEIDKGELLQLVGEWRYDRAQRAGSAGYDKAAEAYEECANELEELIGASTSADGAREEP